MNTAVTALKTVFYDQADSIFDYGSESDFKHLWNFEELPPSEFFIIVWSQTAKDSKLWPIDASASLSPVDWAAAYAKHLGTHPWPEVLIIDTDPQSHVKTPSLAHFHSLRPDQLPWLRLDAAPSLNDIAVWLTKPARSVANKEEVSALDRFLREIHLNLTEVRKEGDYDRHSISNIVAPMFLLGDTTKKTLHSQALVKLVTACGFCRTGLPSEYSEAKEDEEKGEGLQILLVDDQSDHGWTQWLQNILPKAEIQGETNPNKLLDSLISQLESATDQKDLRFRLKLPGLKNPAKPVLFLDLRLFSGHFKVEKVFFKKLLDLIEHRFLKRNDLAWLSFDATDKVFIKTTKAIENNELEPESPEYHEALTWLPRVLALADMSLPIVLFSSTDRRSIINKFSNYRSVLTGFDKSLSFGASKGGTNINSLLARCRNILAVRERALHALGCSRRISSQLFEVGNFGHFELTIDESGSGKKMVIGGMVTGFLNQADAQEFDDRLVRAGVRYFQSLAGPTQSGDPKNKSEECETEFEEVVQQWRSEGKPLLLATLTLDGIEPFRVPLNFLDMNFMDLRWRLGVEALMEVFLSEVVGPLKSSSDASVSIFAPTRAAPVSKKKTAHQYEFLYGTPLQRLGDHPDGRPKWGNNVVAQSHAFDVVRRVLMSHSLSVQLATAKYVRLAYSPRTNCLDWFVPSKNIYSRIDSRPQAQPPDQQIQRIHDQRNDWRAGLRATHYVIDQFLRQRAGWTCVGSEEPSAHEKYDNILHGNIAASRFLDTNRVVEALSTWRYRYETNDSWRHGITSISDLIGARIGDALEGLDGDCFLRSANMLAEATARKPIKAGEREGRVNKEPTRFMCRLGCWGGEFSRETVFNLVKTICHLDLWDCDLSEDPATGLTLILLYLNNVEEVFDVSSKMEQAGYTAEPMIMSLGEFLEDGSYEENDNSIVEPQTEIKPVSLVIEGIPKDFFHTFTKSVQETFLFLNVSTFERFWRKVKVRQNSPQNFNGQRTSRYPQI